MCVALCKWGFCLQFESGDESTNMILAGCRIRKATVGCSSAEIGLSSALHMSQSPTTFAVHLSINHAIIYWQLFLAASTSVGKAISFQGKSYLVKLSFFPHTHPAPLEHRQGRDGHFGSSQRAGSSHFIFLCPFTLDEKTCSGSLPETQAFLQ